MAACRAGQSVGSGPTCHLAAKTPDLAGVVLHSALASGEPPSGLRFRLRFRFMGVPLSAPAWLAYWSRC